MEFKEIQFDVDQGIATMTLNRPDLRNAITSPEMIAEVKAACQAANEDINIKVLILTGSDPAFSSGGNVKDMKNRQGMFGGNPVEVMENYRSHLHEILLAVYDVQIPTIAAINGSAIGAGCGIALMCDIRVASKKAKFGETFLDVGLIPGDGGAYTLPRVVGMAKACELIFTGKIIDADTAAEIGLINYVVEHEELLAKAKEIATRIAGKPPAALRMAKQLLRTGQTASLPHVLEQSAAFQSLCHLMEDHDEALDAMFEKRKPVFTGK